MKTTIRNNLSLVALLTFRQGNFHKLMKTKKTEANLNFAG